MDKIFKDQTEIKDLGLISKAKIISYDFNFVTQLRRGSDLNYYSSIKILLEYLFKEIN